LADALNEDADVRENVEPEGQPQREEEAKYVSEYGLSDHAEEAPEA
jgi:hypothetical protein